MRHYIIWLDSPTSPPEGCLTEQQAKDMTDDELMEHLRKKGIFSDSIGREFHIEPDAKFVFRGQNQDEPFKGLQGYWACIEQQEDEVFHQINDAIEKERKMRGDLLLLWGKAEQFWKSIQKSELLPFKDEQLQRDWNGFNLFMAVAAAKGEEE